MEIWGFSGNDGAWTAPLASAPTDQDPYAKLGPHTGGVEPPNTITTQTASVDNAPLTASLVGNLSLESVQEGLNIPVAFAFAPDGRVFYNELQAGGVRIIKDGAVLPDPFVSLSVVGRNEMGLLGLALDPDFATEPFVYVFYTYQDVDGTFNRISRFRAIGDVGGSEEILLNRLPSNSFHNSGRLQFGPDGMLYASLGDTGDAAQSQDPQTLPGKILRMHSDGALPGDNPFAGSYTYLYGIRNVFGFQFTPSGTLLFTENGPFGNDEVNLGLRGENYGWPIVQGANPDPGFVSPLVVFNPAIAPTGLVFYTGTNLGSAYAQAAYFGSWNFGRLYRLVGDVESGQGSFSAQLVLDPGLGGLLDAVNGPDGNLYVSFSDRIALVIASPTPDTTDPTITISSPSDGATMTSASVTVTGTAADNVAVDKVEVSADGTNWVLATGSTSWSGTVTLAEGPNTIFARARDTSGNTATVSIAVTVDTVRPTADAGEDQTANVGATVPFDASGSSDDVAIVSYEWGFGDGSTGTDETTTHTYADPGTYTVILTVSDAAGNTDTDLLTVAVETPPPGFQLSLSVATFASIGVVAAVAAVAALLFLRRRRRRKGEG